MDKKMFEYSYEEAVKILEDIVYKLENGNVNLDESLKLYEESISLYRYCNEILNNAEMKITQFKKKDDEIEEVEVDE